MNPEEMMQQQEQPQEEGMEQMQGMDNPQEEGQEQEQPFQPDDMGAMAGMSAPADSLMNEGLQDTPDPIEMLPEVVNQYMDYAIGTKNNAELGETEKASIMLQMAQAINYLVPLLKDDAQNDLMMKQAELQLKAQEHQMNMQMKQAELEMKQQEHGLKLEHTQAENQLKLQQQQETHQHTLVQSQESHKSKMEQQKQAAQLKPTSKQGNEGAK
jgi:hypothetical protein